MNVSSGPLSLLGVPTSREGSFGVGGSPFHRAFKMAPGCGDHSWREAYTLALLWSSPEKNLPSFLALGPLSFIHPSVLQGKLQEGYADGGKKAAEAAAEVAGPRASIGKQRQGYLCEFETNLVYKGSSRTVRMVMPRNPALKKTDNDL